MRQRDAELRRLSTRLQALAAEVGRERIAVCGDFNLDADAAPLVEWARTSELRNAFVSAHGAPLTSWNPAENPNAQHSTRRRHPTGELKRGAALLYAAYDDQPQSPDHIFVGRGLEVQQIEPAFERPLGGSMTGQGPLMVSDHIGLQATLSVL